MRALVGFEFEFAAPEDREEQIEQDLEKITGLPVRRSGSPGPGARFLRLAYDRSARFEREEDDFAPWDYDKEDADDHVFFEGYEIITPPLPPAEVFDLARRIAEWLARTDYAFSHEHTGVHVTIDADDPSLLAGLLLLRHFTPEPGPDSPGRERWADPGVWDQFVDCVVHRVTHRRGTAPGILLACAKVFDTKYAALHRRRADLWELRWPGGEGWEYAIESIIRQVASILRRSAMAARYGLRAIEAALRATARRHGVRTFLPDGLFYRSPAEFLRTLDRLADQGGLDEVVWLWVYAPDALRRVPDVVDRLVTWIVRGLEPSLEAREALRRKLRDDPALLDTVARHAARHVARMSDATLRRFLRRDLVRTFFLGLPADTLRRLAAVAEEEGAGTLALHLTTRITDVEADDIERVLRQLERDDAIADPIAMAALEHVTMWADPADLRPHARRFAMIIDRWRRSAPGWLPGLAEVYERLWNAGVPVVTERPVPWDHLLAEVARKPRYAGSWKALADAVHAHPDGTREVLRRLPTVWKQHGLHVDRDPLAPLVITFVGGDPRRLRWRGPNDIIAAERPGHAIADIEVLREPLRELARVLPRAALTAMVRVGMPPSVFDDHDIAGWLETGRLRPEEWVALVERYASVPGHEDVLLGPRVLWWWFTRAPSMAPAFPILRRRLRDPRFRARLADVVRQLPVRNRQRVATALGIGDAAGAGVVRSEESS